MSPARNQLRLSGMCYRLAREIGGSVVTVDMGERCEPHLECDFRRFLLEQVDKLFSSHPILTPSAMVLATNCSSNPNLSATRHGRHTKPVSGMPDSMDAARTIEFANSSADFVARLVLSPRPRV